MGKKYKVVRNKFLVPPPKNAEIPIVSKFSIKKLDKTIKKSMKPKR